MSAVLVGILAAATVPTLSEFVETRDAESTARTLASLAAGVAAYKAAVVQGAAGTNDYPHLISQLTNAITAASLSSCNTTYTSIGATTNLVANWNANAPFVTFYIPPGGLQTPLGLIQDAMIRSAVATPTVGTLALVMNAVDSIDAAKLERIVDGDDATAANGATGVLRVVWSGTGSATRTATVQYLFPIAARC